MVTDQNHLSDSTPIEQEVIRYTKILAQVFGLNEQNAKVYSTLSGENRALKKQLEDYHFQYITLERRVKSLERDVGSLEDELENLDEYVVEDLDECVDRETVVDIIHEIVPSLISRRGLKGNRNFSYTIETDMSEESDSGEIVEESSGL